MPTNKRYFSAKNVFQTTHFNKESSQNKKEEIVDRMKEYPLKFYCRPKNDTKVIVNFPNVSALTSAMLEIYCSGSGLTDRQTESNKELTRCNMTHVCCAANI